jgi:hypothetical protein
MQPITDDYVRKLNELDRPRNEPDVQLQPELVWRLLDEVSEQSPTTEGAIRERPSRSRKQWAMIGR